MIEFDGDGKAHVGTVRALYGNEKDDSFRWQIEFDEDEKSTTMMDESSITVALEEYKAYEEDSSTITHSSETNSNNNNNSHEKNSSMKNSVDKNSGKKKHYLIYISSIIERPNNFYHYSILFIRE